MIDHGSPLEQCNLPLRINLIKKIIMDLQSAFVLLYGYRMHDHLIRSMGGKKNMKSVSVVHFGRSADARGRWTCVSDCIFNGEDVLPTSVLSDS